MDRTDRNDTYEARTRLDGNDLRAMFACATQLVERNAASINVLNVFPVPDGDTGTNMLLTLRDMMAEVERVEGASAGEVAAAMSRGAMLGARGNSGLILSQFFKGMAKELEGKPDCGTKELASAFRRAREYAYRAVGQPVEGTILTVIDRAARAAQESAEAGKPLHEVFEAICETARRAVALTPTMLAKLREAGVVDAGGQGMSVILEALRMYASDGFEVRDIPVPAPIGVEAGGEVSLGFLDAADEEMYGYCTQFLIQGQDLDDEAVRTVIASLGRSAAVVGDETMLKVHVHAEDPGPIISYGASLGTLGQVKIENMDEQHAKYAAARRQEVTQEAARAAAGPADVVAVAWGRGLEGVFAELGAANILAAGDTMNPSVQQILDAVNGAPSDTVIFLPNNRNIVLTARQAAELSAKTLKVVPSATIPQGIAAMLKFNAEKGLDENLAEMERALSTVRTGEVCRAVRPTQLDGVTVREGQVIGLLERELVACGDAPDEVLVSLLRRAGVSEGDLVTLYWGSLVDEAEADAALREAQAAFPEAEDVQLIPGGQPHYHYIVSIERS